MHSLAKILLTNCENDDSLSQDHIDIVLPSIYCTDLTKYFELDLGFERIECDRSNSRWCGNFIQSSRWSGTFWSAIANKFAGSFQIKVSLLWLTISKFFLWIMVVVKQTFIGKFFLTTLFWKVSWYDIDWNIFFNILLNIHFIVFYCVNFWTYNFDFNDLNTRVWKCLERCHKLKQSDSFLERIHLPCKITFKNKSTNNMLSLFHSWMIVLLNGGHTVCKILLVYQNSVISSF